MVWIFFPPSLEVQETASELCSWEQKLAWRAELPQCGGPRFSPLDPGRCKLYRPVCCPGLEGQPLETPRERRPCRLCPEQGGSAWCPRETHVRSHRILSVQRRDLPTWEGPVCHADSELSLRVSAPVVSREWVTLPFLVGAFRALCWAPVLGGRLSCRCSGLGAWGSGLGPQGAGRPSRPVRVCGRLGSATPPLPSGPCLCRCRSFRGVLWIPGVPWIPRGPRGDVRKEGAVIGECPCPSGLFG